MYPRPEPGEPDPWWETAPVLSLVPADARPRPVGADAPAVPVPGRHASRRRPTATALAPLARLLPDTLRGRLALGPWQLTVVALLVAGGLAVTCWWVVRGDASVMAPVAGSATPLVPVTAGQSAEPSPSTSPGMPASPAARSPTGTVTVDVAGDVRRPGVVELPAGSRVLDALAAAGGPRRGADLGSLNRARLLADGEQIVVGAPPAAGATAAGAGAAGAAGGSPSSPGPLVNLNTASLTELDGLPEVGPVTAQAILDYRADHGGFGSVDELLDVDGIGEVTLAKIAPHVTV